jgi:hypothetical protein
MPVRHDRRTKGALRFGRHLLPLADAKFIQGMVNFRMDSPEVRTVHVTCLKEVQQVPHEFRPEVSFRDVSLNERPNITE